MGEGRFEEFGAGRGGGGVRGRGLQEVGGRGVGFVTAEGEEGEEEVGDGYGEGDEVEGRPGVVVGD